MDIFDKDTVKMIEYAIVFEEIEPDRMTAVKLYQEAVKNVAAADGFDFLEYFYGYSVYSKINTAKNAIECICVATELKNFYNSLQSIGSMNDTTNTWAKYSELRDPDYKRFFFWLAQRDKTPNVSDLSLIKIMTERLKRGNMSNYKITNAYIKDYSFPDIVEKICNGEITVKTDGDLM